MSENIQTIKLQSDLRSPPLKFCSPTWILPAKKVPAITTVAEKNEIPVEVITPLISEPFKIKLSTEAWKMDRFFDFLKSSEQPLYTFLYCLSTGSSTAGPFLLFNTLKWIPLISVAFAIIPSSASILTRCFTDTTDRGIT